MTIEDEARKCCAEIEDIHRGAKKLEKRCSESAKQDLSAFEAKLERFVRQARETSDRLNSGIREGVQGLVDSWRDARDRLNAHLRLIEAKSFLASARRMANEGDFVAERNELAAAVDDLREARTLLPDKDTHLTQLLGEIEQVVAEIQATARATTASIEDAVAHNERLLEEVRLTS